jgi:hypothetical protein
MLWSICSPAECLPRPRSIQFDIRPSSAGSRLRHIARTCEKLMSLKPPTEGATYSVLYKASGFLQEKGRRETPLRGVCQNRYSTFKDIRRLFGADPRA